MVHNPLLVVNSKIENYFQRFQELWDASRHKKQSGFSNQHTHTSPLPLPRWEFPGRTNLRPNKTRRNKLPRRSPCAASALVLIVAKRENQFFFFFLVSKSPRTSLAFTIGANPSQVQSPEIKSLINATGKGEGLHSSRYFKLNNIFAALRLGWDYQK